MLGPRTLPLLVAAVLSAVSVLAVLQVGAADRDRADTARKHALEQTSQATAALGELTEARISNIAGLFNASKQVEADEFAAFTQPMLAESRAASLSYVDVVTAAERAAYERRTGRAIREVTPDDRRVRAAQRPRYAVATYTTINDDGDELLGTDALSRRPDATAIAAATLSGRPHSTTAIWLPATREPGAVLYVPVYGSGAARPRATREPIGYIAAAFRFSDFAPALAPLVPPGTSASFEIAGAPAFQIGQVRGAVSRSEQVVAGRTWQITVSSPPPPKQAFGLTRAQSVGVLLGLLTLLITALTRQAVVAARRANELALLRQRERDQAVRQHQADRAASNALLRHLPDLSVLRFDEELRVVDASGGLIERAGWTHAELLGEDLTELLEGWGPELVEALHGGLVGEASAFPGSGLRVTGLHFWIQVLPLPGDEVGGLLVTSDVTALIGAESERAKAQSRFERLFESAPVGMALVNLNGEFVQVNEALAQITGYHTRELLQMGPPDIIHPDDAEQSREQLDRLFTGEASAISVEDRYRHAEGHTIWGALNATVLLDADGHPEYVLAHLIDVTERHEFAEQLQHLANHDPLTSLRNRRSFEAVLDRQVANTRRYHEPAALLMVDLDHFKAVNDTRGHQAGDRVLVETAGLLRDELRESDTVARLGGDEFAVLLPRASAEEAIAVAEKLAARLHAYGASLPADDRAPALTASIGVAIMRGQHRTVDEALADADGALYRVKTSGRDGFAVAQPRTPHTV